VAADSRNRDAQNLLRDLPGLPGIYRMIDDGGTVIYVGKAGNLRKRVTSYFGRGGASAKTRSMVSQIHHIEVTVTRNETEALLLENNLIKELRPRYNVLLRDDKSYPYIYLSAGEDYPRLSFHRGARRGQGRYFGPYPNAGAVRDTLNLLQKLFRVRQCEDSFFRNRSRPCLQYQIKRCSAPCVGRIGVDEYRRDVRHAMMFLDGKNREVINELVTQMDAAAEQLAYEQAASIRDQIARLRRLQETQYVSGDHGDIDVVSCVTINGVGCIEVFFIRAGRNLGNKTFFPRHPAEMHRREILAAFLPQYYLGREIPPEILVDPKPDELTVIAEALAGTRGGPVRIRQSLRGRGAEWLKMASENATQNLRRHLASKANIAQRLLALQDVLGTEERPQRLECFDISHTGGESPVASCVVFDENGPLKSDYRRFNIENVAPGDDYAAIEQAVTRRYLRLKKGEGRLPDVLLIDGGKGQVRKALEALEELQLSDLTVIGVAKGPARRPGEEVLHVATAPAPITLAPDSVALHLIQQIRDEAHRFALAGHRQQRGKRRSRSSLEGIPGIGPARRRLLLRQFGGLQGVARAGIDELSGLEGINRQLAQRIYDTFHNDDP